MKVADKAPMPEYGITSHFELPPEFAEAKEMIEANSRYTRDHLSADRLIAIYPGLIDGDNIKLSVLRWQKDLPGDHRWMVAGIHHVPHQIELTNFAKYYPWAAFQQAAYNTPGQATWFINELIRFGADSAVLYLPRFHAPRAFGTTVKAALDQDWDGEISVMTWDPVPETNLSLAGFSNRPDYQELFPGEHKRWVEYTQKGDVAHPSTWGRYLT